MTPELGADATASLVYAAVTHVDVIKEITQTTVLGLLGADAHIDSINQSFLTGTISTGSPTPEPTTLMLLGSSFIALGWIRRKQKG
jgi:hypothetical protein